MRKYLLITSALFVLISIAVVSKYENSDYQNVNGALIELHLGGFKMQDVEGKVYDFQCNYGLDVSDYVGENVCVEFRRVINKGGPRYFARTVSLID